MKLHPQTDATLARLAPRFACTRTNRPANDTLADCIRAELRADRTFGTDYTIHLVR